MGRPFHVLFVPALRVEMAAQTRATHHVVPPLTLRPLCRVVSCSCRVFSVVRRAARRVWPIWTSILITQQNHVPTHTSSKHNYCSSNRPTTDTDYRS
jgi:hypothetical protein